MNKLEHVLLRLRYIIIVRYILIIIVTQDNLDAYRFYRRYVMQKIKLL